MLPAALQVSREAAKYSNDSSPFTSFVAVVRPRLTDVLQLRKKQRICVHRPDPGVPSHRRTRKDPPPPGPGGGDLQNPKAPDRRGG
jgi:hypothetical protein